LRDATGASKHIEVRRRHLNDWIASGEIGEPTLAKPLDSRPNGSPALTWSTVMQL
jgi:hypothetical protein